MISITELVIEKKMNRVSWSINMIRVEVESNTGYMYPVLQRGEHVYQVAVCVIMGPPVFGKTTVLSKAYKSNCLAPPHKFAVSVVVVTCPSIVSVLTLP